MAWPRNRQVTKTEAIQEMIEGRKVFMTVWTIDPQRYIYFDGSSFRWDHGGYFLNINTMSGDFRVIVEE